MSVETLTFPDGSTPLDLLLYRSFGDVDGLVEQTLEANPGLAALGPFPPAGTTVTVTVPTAQPSQPATKVVQLYE